MTSVARAITNPPRPVLILAALREELAAVRACIRATRSLEVGRCHAVLGHIDGVPVVVASTGDGADNAARGARRILERTAAGRVVIVGTAGGLSPGLAPGTVLVAREVLDGGRPAPPPDADWAARVERDLGATPATLVSSRNLLCALSGKARVYAGLPPGTVAAVDLETAAFARVAAERRLPYLALRAVSDTAEESLPMDFNALRDSTGAVDRRRVVLKALLHLSLVPSLWRLRRRVAACSDNLAVAARVALAGGGP